MSVFFFAGLSSSSFRSRLTCVNLANSRIRDVRDLERAASGVTTIPLGVVGPSALVSAALAVDIRGLDSDSCKVVNEIDVRVDLWRGRVSALDVAFFVSTIINGRLAYSRGRLFFPSHLPANLDARACRFELGNCPVSLALDDEAVVVGLRVVFLGAEEPLGDGPGVARSSGRFCRWNGEGKARETGGGEKERGEMHSECRCGFGKRPCNGLKLLEK